MFFSMLTLFAQAAGDAAGDAAKPAGDQPNLLFQLLPFIAIGFIFYFLMIRPQSKQRQERQQMISAVKKNDRVLTIGGIWGTVTNVQPEDDSVTIRVDESTGTKLEFSMGAIARVDRGEEEDGR